MKHALGILLALAGIVGASQAADAQSTNLIQDGSFSQAIGTVSSPSPWGAYYGNGVTQTVSSSTGSAITSSTAPFTLGTTTPLLVPSTFALFGAGGSGADVFQKFQTVAGTQYVLNFQYFAYGPTTYSATIVSQVEDFSNPSLLRIQSFLSSTSSADFSGGLISTSLSFTGNGDLFELDIEDFSNTSPSVVSLVTNVSVTDIPEPVSIELMGMALLGVGAVRYRRQS